MNRSEMITYLEELLERPKGSLRGDESLASFPSWDSVAVVGFIALIDDGTYRHLFIFPNLVLGITCGSLVSAQTYWPVTATTSTVDYAEYLCASKADSLAANTIRQGLVRHFTELNERILGEDRVAAERVQLTVMQSTRRAVLGTMESRIAAFQATVTQCLGK